MSIRDVSTITSGLECGGKGINWRICYAVAVSVATVPVKSASVRELKNHTSELLRQAAKQDVIITSRGRPVACLVGLQPGDVSVKVQVRRDKTDDRYKREISRLLAQIRRLKPEKGKKWISQENHDAALYGALSE